MANKVMKSYRFDEDTIYDLKNIAEKFGVSATDAIEICIDWAFKSGMVYALEDVKKRDGRVNVKRSVEKATSGGEITNEVRYRIWTA